MQPRRRNNKFIDIYDSHDAYAIAAKRRFYFDVAHVSLSIIYFLQAQISAVHEAPDSLANRPLLSGGTMNEVSRLKYLQIALVLVGLILIFGVYLLMAIWPSGWMWTTGHTDYPLMIVGIYATLGVFLILAARHPLAHLSLIWFTIWSSIVHGAIMTYQALANPENHGHLMGDVPALFIIAVVLAVLTPRRGNAKIS